MTSSRCFTMHVLVRPQHEVKWFVYLAMELSKWPTKETAKTAHRWTICPRACCQRREIIANMRIGSERQYPSGAGFALTCILYSQSLLVRASTKCLASCPFTNRKEPPSRRRHCPPPRYLHGPPLSLMTISQVDKGAGTRSLSLHSIRLGLLILVDLWFGFWCYRRGGGDDGAL